MNKLKYSFLAKTLAFVLFIVLLITSFGGTLCTLYMYSDGYFLESGSNFYNTRSCVNTVNEYSEVAFSAFYNPQNLNIYDAKNNPQLDKVFSKDISNFVFSITDENGVVLYSNYTDQKYGSITTRIYNLNHTYRLNSYVTDPITAKDNFYWNYRIFNALYPQRYAVIIISAVSAVLTLAAAIFLFSAAGHRKGREGIILRVFDRIPLEINAAGALIIMAGLFNNIGSISYSFDDFGGQAAASAFGCICILLMFSLARTFAVRYKAGKWWQNTIVYKILKQIQKAGRFIGYLFSNLPMLWKTLLMFTAYITVNGILIISFLFGFGSAKALPFLLGLVFNFGVLACLCVMVLQMQHLKKAGEKLADGDYTAQINTQNLLWDFKSHGNNLNNIGQGMSKAVDARMKSERFKTELITNVSHDIKTPITSIVNYVDLLKKEDIKDMKLLEYIDVLDRQTGRLKKLTEDLVEASKASTGNIAVVPVRTDLVEFLQQSVGEYSERFAANQIEAVIRNDDEPEIVLADGRLLWRVFDNLLGNICKYSQPGTRIYADISKNAGKITITMKNISRYPLNITSDELMERFVRGDISRSTEGSGLGLSIAKSLTELQNGSFKISIDGDLFKVMISFDSVE